jgi:phosphopantothenoylcysteine decarboxylase/phosphopantothenate--cysteine ligase
VSEAVPRKMLITAGPTHEPLDEVRYLANRSSGKLGACLAEAAREAGWEVTLLIGPTSVARPSGVDPIAFESIDDLESLLQQHFLSCDVLIMAAAIADYRPRPVSERKLPRAGGALVIELEPTPDLVAGCAGRRQAGQRIVGFALEESGVLEARAREKLRSKGLDAIVANPLETMGADEIRGVLLTASGERIEPPGSPLSKADFARWLIDWISAWP